MCNRAQKAEIRSQVLKTNVILKVSLDLGEGPLKQHTSTN